MCLVSAVSSGGLRVEGWRGLTYGGEDSPVLGGEVAEGFGVELHCGRIF